MKPNHYIEVIPTTVKGIPAQLGVVDFIDQPPDRSCWDSDMDYNGYTEVEFELLDRKGYPAAWLGKKLTDDDRYQLEWEIIHHMRNQYHD